MQLPNRAGSCHAAWNFGRLKAHKTLFFPILLAETTENQPNNAILVVARHRSILTLPDVAFAGACRMSLSYWRGTQQMSIIRGGFSEKCFTTVLGKDQAHVDAPR